MILKLLYKIGVVKELVWFIDDDNVYRLRRVIMSPRGDRFITNPNWLGCNKLKLEPGGSISGWRCFRWELYS